VERIIIGNYIKSTDGDFEIHAEKQAVASCWTHILLIPVN